MGLEGTYPPRTPFHTKYVTASMVDYISEKLKFLGLGLWKFSLNVVAFWHVKCKDRIRHQKFHGSKKKFHMHYTKATGNFFLAFPFTVKGINAKL